MPKDRLLELAQESLKNCFHHSLRENERAGLPCVNPEHVFARAVEAMVKKAREERTDAASVLKWDVGRKPREVPPENKWVIPGGPKVRDPLLVAAAATADARDEGRAHVYMTQDRVAFQIEEAGTRAAFGGEHDSTT